MQKPDIVKIQEICITAVLEQTDVNSLINSIYHVLQLPIIVFDETITLIAYAFPKQFYFQDWFEIVEHGAAPQRKQPYMFSDYQEFIYRNKKPTLINWGTTKDRPQTCCPIIYKDFLYGYIGISFEDCPFVDDVMEIESIIASTLGYLLNRSAGQVEDGSLSEDAVAALLLDTVPDPKIASLYQSYTLSPYYFSILHLFEPRKALLQHIQSTLCKSIPGILSAVYENQDVYLLISKAQQDTLSHTVQQLMFTLEIKDYYYCISDSFNDPAQLSDYRLQAHYLLETCTMFRIPQHTCCFSEYYLDILLFFTVRQCGRTASIPGALRTLADHDQQEGKHYIETLTCYFDNLMSLSKTADMLHIHPNTIRIRLSRISEITQLDLSDRNITNQLRIGLRLIHNLERESQNEPLKFL